MKVVAVSFKTCAAHCCEGLSLGAIPGFHSLLSESHFVAGLYSPFSFISRITFPAILNASTPEGTPT